MDVKRDVKKKKKEKKQRPQSIKDYLETIREKYKNERENPH